jgi:cytochrome b
MGKLKVWDGFIRSFHWLLVVAIATLYFSAEEGMMELHFVAGFLHWRFYLPALNGVLLAVKRLSLVLYFIHRLRH